MQPEQPSTAIDPVAEAQRAFDAAYAAPADWETRLQRSDKGNVIPSQANVVSILTHRPEWLGVIALDEFSGRLLKRRPPPFDRPSTGEWGDVDDARLILWLSRQYRIEPRTETMVRAVSCVADLNRFHLVREYLERVEWDGKARLPTWTSDYLGTAATRYTMQVGQMWMISAVARIFQPGCKVDHVLILEGLQNIGKSSALGVLGGEWFSDAPFRLGDREASMVIRGKWIVELAELDSFNKAETSAAKAFFTRRDERYREPWGRRAIDVPRQCVFAGSVNGETYLRDETGNRRYWPVRCGVHEGVSIEGLRADRDQLWAEAVVLYRNGMRWWPAAEDRAMFAAEQEERYVGDAWELRISDWLDDPDNRGNGWVRMSELLGRALGLDASKWTRAEQVRVGAIMHRLEWQRKRMRIREGEDRGGLEWVYVRPGREDAPSGGKA